MWDNPRLLNLAAASLYALCALAVLASGLILLVRSPAFPLKSITVVGDLQHVRQSDVIAALQGRVRGTFFTVDLDELRTAFESIQWVRHAEVRRRWPARLEVRVEEHRALARWARREDERLVNVYGESFSATSDAELPALAGPAGSEREVARRYAEFTRILEPAGLAPRQVLLSDRLAWQVRLANGMVLQLGRDLPRDPLAARLERFVEAYPRAVVRLEQGGARGPVRFDLRYPNGFALRVPEADSRVTKAQRPPA